MSKEDRPAWTFYIGHSTLNIPLPSISTTEIRVRYGETDQMGVAYHAHYLAWCDAARTNHMRESGVSYRRLEEEQGIRLAVVDARVRYRQPARFDDLLRIRCWVRDVGSRRVEFGYVIERAGGGPTLATARTTLIALNSSYVVTALPSPVRTVLEPTADPVRL